MPNDAKLGLVVGVGLVITVAVVFFRKDLYDRDAQIIEGLDEPFLVKPPKGAREALERR